MEYENIGLVSRHVSNISSRKDVNTTLYFASSILSTPIIASPMPDVCDGEMASTLNFIGSYGFIHRFMSIEEQLRQYRRNLIFPEVTVTHKPNYCGCAIGIKNDYLERFEELYSAGCRSFCIDVANGANVCVFNAIDKLYSLHSDIYITAGNVASKECYEQLCKLNVYAIRVGIAGGKVCSTKIETGIYKPMVEVLLDIAKVKDKYNTLLIADSGIRQPQDMCKALALGADLVMAGGIFASTIESPARTIKIGDEIKKIYRGAASFSVQQDIGKNPEFVEGIESLIPLTTNVAKVIKRFNNGLRSAMSYMNARDLTSFRENVEWCKLS